MSSLTSMFEADNLRRAWRWLKSNPDASYKQYCGDVYRAFAIAEDALLDNLRDCLRRGLYTPQHASKLYFPKSSGIMRPYSILTVEDQIVYQAAVNVVAEALVPRVRHRYLKEVYGHLYAGKTSAWFYQKWDRGYGAFNRSARKAFRDGFRFTASFDLTACYDSLDHGVLKHALGEIGCDDEFNTQLVKWLSVWTATQRKIYMSHGVPQGPLSSGLLSEVVLRHFDERRKQEEKVRYFRYVDDIRLFAKKESHLRSTLVKLDLLSKDIGLFPQSSKIHIHEVFDIESELKSLSDPGGTPLVAAIPDQRIINAQLQTLTPKFRVSNTTRFKFLLSHATPNARLTNRLWQVFARHPEFYNSFARYLARYRVMPRIAGDSLVKAIREHTLYDAVRAALIAVAIDRLLPADAKRLDFVVKPLFRVRAHPGELLAVAGRWCIQRGLLTPQQIQNGCKKAEPWWTRTQLVKSVDPATASSATLSSVVNQSVRDPIGDVAIIGAHLAASHGVRISEPRVDIHPSAVCILKAFGIIRRAKRTCGIQASIDIMLGPCPVINWRALFGSHYRNVERHIVTCRGYMSTDITAWVNSVDVFNDWLLSAIHAADPTIGRYTLGGIGSALSAPTGRLASRYPALYAFAESIHTNRLQSNLSHPIDRKSGKPTNRIRYTYVYTGRRLFRNAVQELSIRL